MRQAVIRCGIVGLGFLLLASPGTKGQDIEETRATLRGLQGVHVVAEDMRTDVERDGLTKNQIQTDVELRLRKGGIRVLTEQEQRSTPGQPWLYVRVTTYKRENSELYAFMIDLELKQDVYLARDPNISVSAVTWSHTGRIGTTGTSHLRQIRESVVDIVDAFINAYLAVNPDQAGRMRPSTGASPPAKRR